jgi:hypothetical protein
LGIERLMLLQKKDTLRDIIEKISAIPENKLVYIECSHGNPTVKSILTLSDLFSYIGKKN